MNKSIFTTRPDLPDYENFTSCLQRLWETRFLTNQGEFARDLEEQLADRLGVGRIALMSSGTMALLASLKTLGVQGSVITTPFTFAATPQVLSFLNLSPIFVDTYENGFNMDPDKIPQALDDETSAILPVHTFGHPCDAAKIESIAKAAKLKTIYDGAQAFDVMDSGGAIVRHGDATALSFHATKVFHTCEGGAVVCQTDVEYQSLSKFRNFGIVDEMTVEGPGLNGKMSELSAIMGLTMLPLLDGLRQKRKKVDQKYRLAVGEIKGLSLPNTGNPQQHNYGYFPILVDEEFPVSAGELKNALHSQGIVARKYFNPLVSQFKAYRNLPSALPSNLPNATRLSQRVLCLPIYSELDVETLDRIIDILLQPKRLLR